MYDAIIVGAGPAGSAAARVAVRAGLDVLILEKEAFPRYKPCGGSVSDRALSLLDFSVPDDLCERTINGVRVHFRDKTMEIHKGYRLSTLVTRSKFDDFLLQKAQDAGANLVIQKVQGYRELENHVEVLTKRKKYKSRFLVISAGYQDRLKDSILGHASRDQYGVSMVTEVEEDDLKIEERMHDFLAFHYDVVEAGYGWIFPHRGYYSVGIWGRASYLKDLRGTMMRFLRKNGFHGNYRLHGHKIPLGSISMKIASNRVLLAGDSGGFVDAFTGEGIYYALRSGQIAAQVISEKDSRDVSRTYESLCRKDFGEELRYALWLSRFLIGHKETLAHVLTSHKEVLDMYLELAAAKCTYKDFVRWGVPRLIHVDDYNNKIDKLPKILKGLLGNERVNFKMLLNDGSILRVGYVIEKAHVKRVVENGLMNPTIIVLASESAISRISGSDDPVAAIQKEIELKRVAVKGQNLAIRAKLDVALLSTKVLPKIYNFINIV